MNAKELELLRRLEFIKYITLKGERVVHSFIEEREHYLGGVNGLSL